MDKMNRHEKFAQFEKLVILRPTLTMNQKKVELKRLCKDMSLIDH